MSLFLYILIGGLCYKAWSKWSRWKDDEMLWSFIIGWPIVLPIWIVGLVFTGLYQLAINIVLSKEEQPKKEENEIFTFEDFLNLR